MPLGDLIYGEPGKASVSIPGRVKPPLLTRHRCKASVQRLCRILPASNRPIRFVSGALESDASTIEQDELERREWM
jgi:hypothetical protein